MWFKDKKIQSKLALVNVLRDIKSSLMLREWDGPDGPTKLGIVA